MNTLRDSVFFHPGKKIPLPPGCRPLWHSPKSESRFWMSVRTLTYRRCCFFNFFAVLFWAKEIRGRTWYFKKILTKESWGDLDTMLGYPSFFLHFPILHCDESMWWGWSHFNTRPPLILWEPSKCWSSRFVRSLSTRTWTPIRSNFALCVR